MLLTRTFPLSHTLTHTHTYTHTRTHFFFSRTPFSLTAFFEIWFRLITPSFLPSTIIALAPLHCEYMNSYMAISQESSRKILNKLLTVINYMISWKKYKIFMDYNGFILFILFTFFGERCVVLRKESLIFV